MSEFEKQRPLPGAALYDQEGRLIKRLGTGPVYVPLDAAPRELRQAVQSTHDAREINGYLARQMIEPEGLWNRLQLALLPTVLQRRYSERERLEMFLNQAYFGEGAVGMEAASQTYFHKPVQELDLAESALLAALIQEPESASPFQNPDRAQELRASVLQAMREQGHIDAEAEQQASQSPWNWSAGNRATPTTSPLTWAANSLSSWAKTGYSREGYGLSPPSTVNCSSSRRTSSAKPQ